MHTANCNQKGKAGYMAERSESQMVGTPTGFTEVDKLFRGLRGGDLIILAARPGAGKTTFALNVATNAAKSGTTVLFFSLEMGGNDITQRILCSEARVSLHQFRQGSLQEGDQDAIMNAADALSGLELYIDDTPALSVPEMRVEARHLLRDKKKGLIIVDYLEIIPPLSNCRDVSRVAELAQISCGLKVLAKEMGIPVLALSNLRSPRGERRVERPTLSDFRNWVPVEQDADIIMFIDRSENEVEDEINGNGKPGTAELIVAKHRNGPIRDITLRFNPEFARFDNHTDAFHM